MRVALLCIDPWRVEECEDNRPFNYAVRRIQAAILGHPDLSELELELIESSSLDVDKILARIEAFDPDVIGASAYVWSFPTLLEVCRHAKRSRPDRMVIFGGPSSRPELFELPQHSDGAEVVDAICVGEGEECIQEILLAPDRNRDTLLRIPGLAVHTRGAWARSPERVLGSPDIHPSPYRMGLMPEGVTLQFESCRGCPLSCTFCEWGDTGVSSRNFGFDYLVKELEAMRKLDSRGRGTWLLDPGLNLNSRAFDNLKRAEAEVGILREVGAFRCEVYPSKVNDEHLAFLERVRARYAGIGLQSFDADVLKSLDRPFNEDRFNQVVGEIASIVPDATVEVILGLPGDNPDNFKRTVEKVRKLPVGIRVFHCLVLPSALMTRAPASFDLKYDPFTLQVISCRGWSRKDLEETREWLDDAACSECGDIPHGGTWKFLRPNADRAHTTSVAGGPSILTTETKGHVAGGAAKRRGYDVTAPEAMHTALSRRLLRAAPDWKLRRVTMLEGDLRRGVGLLIDGAAMASIVVTPARPGAPSFRVIDELAYSYTRGEAKPDTEAFQTLDRVIAQVHPIMRATILGLRVGAKERRRALPLADPRAAGAGRSS
jgi:radical SAM superfamily enzyme YgiQ (UPF0313 family)